MGGRYGPRYGNFNIFFSYFESFPKDPSLNDQKYINQKWLCSMIKWMQSTFLLRTSFWKSFHYILFNLKDWVYRVFHINCSSNIPFSSLTLCFYWSWGVRIPIHKLYSIQQQWQIPFYFSLWSKYLPRENKN